RAPYTLCSLASKILNSSPMNGKNPKTAPLANTTPSPPKGKPRSKPSKPTGKSSPSLFIPSSNPMVSKILHINISGMVFPMAEPAYQARQVGGDSVRVCCSRHVSREEIVADLVSRMAVLFSAKVSTRHQVLLQVYV